MEGVNNVNQNGVEQNPNQPHSQPAENQPQPIGAENQPQPIGAENQPQPIGAENQPQPIGAENQPQPIGAENQPQPIGAENQPQPASIAGNLGNGIGDDEDAIEQRKRTSDVWPHFHRLKVHGVGKAQCKYCRKILSGESNSGTSHLRSHRNRCIQKKIHDGRKKVLGPDYLPTGKPQLVATEYNYDVTIKELCSMILVHEYPLSIVDHIGFRRYSCSLQPLFQVPSRNTIKKEILTLYGVQSAKIRRELDGNRGRIAVTTDMWTATNHKRGYMALTAHYIDNSWKLRSIMLRFLYVPAPHTSERLANRLCTSLMIWNIDGKLSAITLDNCTTNDSMVTQQIARDFLAIPITSVASESAFSSCGRLLDPHRSKLQYSTVEAMMCTRNWVNDELIRDPDTKLEQLEGMFSTLIMEESSVEEHDDENVQHTVHQFDDID